MKNGKLKMKNKLKSSLRGCVSAFCLFTFASSAFAQIENPPAPSAPRSAKIPAVQESTLPNNLKIVVVERKNVPLVTASLLVKSGANDEADALAGVADMTTSLLLKGTKTRNATQIAEQMEFLGGNINSGSNWNSSNVTVNVTSDKLDRALAIMSDVILNPTFAPKEIALYKTQTLDALNVQLKQPSTLAGFVASRYTYGEHSAFGTPETLAKINRADISDFYKENFTPQMSVLIFAGDISKSQATALAQKYFGVWKKSPDKITSGEGKNVSRNNADIIRRILVVDLPNSGQAAVTYAKKLNAGRSFYNSSNDSVQPSDIYFPALVTNSVLGGGYTNRLNLEIRIKQGLSYGARSGVTWRDENSNFSAGAQTKNVSAAQVAELIANEINRIATESVGQDELKPRTATLTGNFSNSLETTNGLAAQIRELYLYGLNPNELNAYTKNLQNVTDAQVRDFASKNIRGGDIIIVGDYAKFKDDLQKRFPNQKIEVIAASQLDLNSDTLRKN